MGVKLSGFVHDINGNAQNNLTVELFERTDLATSVTSTSTDEDGKWNFDYSTQGRYDVRIDIGGGQYFWIKYDDIIQAEQAEIGSLLLRGSDNAYVTTFTSTPTAARTVTVPDATFTLAGINLAQTFSANQTFTGTVTVGSDGSGTDVIFYSGTAGDNFTWDASEEKLTITGTNGQTALDIADGNVVVADNLTVSGNATLNGDVTLGSAADDVITINGTVAGANAVIFEGGTANAHETTLTPTDPTADAVIKLPAMSAGTYHVPVLDTASTTAISSTPEEINLVDGATARGTDAVGTGDGLLVNDGGTMKMTNVDTVSTYFASHSVGGTNIITTGTIGTGVWAATDVAVAHGGTGASTATGGFDALSPMTAEGDVLYGGSSGTVTKLAKGSDADVLTLASGIPSWATPTTGDITGVTAGVGLSGGGSSGGVTLTLALSELTDTAIANGDYIVFTDTTNSNASVKGDLADVATLFAGTNLTASSSVISVADAFLVNNANDVTTGTVTMAHLIVGDGGNIGSASATSAMSIDSGGSVYVGADTSNGASTLGLNINQGAADDVILTLSSTDVNHGDPGFGWSGGAYDDAFALFKKAHAGAGGLEIVGIQDDEAGAKSGFVIQSITSDAGKDNTHTAAGRAAVQLNVWGNDGGSATDIGDGYNLFGVARYYEGGSGYNEKFIIDADGNFWFDGAAQTAFDEFNDTHLVRALDHARITPGSKDLIKSKWDDFVTYSESTLIELGILGDTIENGGLINMTGVQRLHNGAIWQLYTKLMDTESRLARTENKLLALEEG